MNPVEIDRAAVLRTKRCVYCTALSESRFVTSVRRWCQK